jgi:hypothetical protein
MHAETLSFLLPRREFSLGTIRDCSMYRDARVYCLWCHAEMGDDCRQENSSCRVFSSKFPLGWQSQAILDLECAMGHLCETVRVPLAPPWVLS